MKDAIRNSYKVKDKNLINNADKASLKSKRNGKNQLTIWKPELNMD